MMPSSPLIGRRSGTSSPNRIDMTKDLVIGELASRMRRPVPDFNKNKRGGDSTDSSRSNSPALHLQPNSREVINLVSRRRGCESEDREIATSPHNEPVKTSVVANLKLAQLKPQSASAPCSPRLGLRRPPQQITITSAATLKVTNNQNNSGPSTPRNRSKSPAVNRLAPPNSPRSASRGRSRGQPSTSTRQPSPSPARRSKKESTTKTALVGGGHTSVKMSTKRKSPGRTVPGGGYNRSISANPRSKSYNRTNSADPDINDPAIQAKIGNRMTKTVEKTIGKCGVCVKPVTVEGCTAFGKVYHKECFKCCVCKRKIDGKFFERNGKPYCAKDYEKIVETCCVCKEPIKGDCIEAGKKSYHPGCMRCFVCGEALRGQYFTYEGEPICEKDYKLRAEKCHDCGEPIVGTCFTLNNKNYCEEHYRDRADTCPKCDEQIIGPMVRTSSAAFHPECFTCVVCNKDLSHDQFITDEKMQIFCPDDYARKKAYRCVTCKKPIVPKGDQTTAPRLRALGKDFHPDCFKCEDCGLLLDSKVKGKECYPFKNQVLCIRCNRKKLSSDESSGSDDDN